MKILHSPRTESSRSRPIAGARRHPFIASAFRASPDAWPSVDFLHRDPLGDDSLFAEPELFRVFLDDDADRPRVEYGGPLPPATIARLAYIAGEHDFGLVMPAASGAVDAFAVMRAADLETILGFGAGTLTRRPK